VAEVPGSNPGAPTLPAPSRGGAPKLRRYGLAALAALIALNLWTGSPLLALWIGSQVQGDESQPSMGAFLTVLGCLVVFSVLLYQALKRVAHAYREAAGALPTMRTHAPWLRSMRGERPEHAGPRAQASAPERIIVACVILAALAFEIWFFFFSGSSIGGGSGR
jgi:hypothetical protein